MLVKLHFLSQKKRIKIAFLASAAALVVGTSSASSVYDGDSSVPIAEIVNELQSNTTTRNSQPQEIRSVEGLLEVVLTVDLVNTPELNRTAPGYNGAPVGPTLRAKPGDKVRITLVNNLEPSPADELKLFSFAMTPVSDSDPDKEEKEINQTLLVNRLQYPTANLFSLPREEYWGKSFQNLHFHGLMVDPTIGKFTLDGR